MSWRATLDSLLVLRFGHEYSALTPEARAVVLDDFADMVATDYDVSDPTTCPLTARESAHDAAIEYRRRIGSGNLDAYAKCLLVKPR